MTEVALSGLMYEMFGLAVKLAGPVLVVSMVVGVIILPEPFGEQYPIITFGPYTTNLPPLAMPSTGTILYSIFGNICPTEPAL